MSIDDDCSRKAHLDSSRILGIKNSQVLNNLVFLTFVILVTLLKFFHEPWRDELQEYGFMWRRPPTSSVFQEFFSGGYLPPYPYFNTVFVFSGSYEHKKWVVWVILAIASYLFIQVREIPLIQKALLLLSPYIFFEWGTIDRNYTLILAVTFIILGQLSLKVKPRYILISLLALNLLGLWGMFVSVLLVGSFLAFSRILGRRSLYIYGGSVALGCLPYLLNINKGYSGDYDGQVDFSDPHRKIALTLKHLFILLFGESGESPNSWVRNWPQFASDKIGFFIISILILAVLIYGHSINKKLFILLLLATSVYFFWTSFIYPGGPRHWFFLPFSWVVIVFTHKIVSDKPLSNTVRTRRYQKITTTILTFVISFQTLAQIPYSIKLVTTEIREPFSSVHQLNFEGSADHQLLIYPDYLGVTFLAEKNIDGLFLQGNRVGAFRGFRNLRTVVVEDLQKRCFDKSNKPILLTNQLISEKITKAGIGRVIQTSQPAIVPEEGNISLVLIYQLCTEKEWSEFVKIIES